MTATLSATRRADHIVYGRYLEGLSPVMLVLGLLWVLNATPRVRALAFAVVGLILAVTANSTRLYFPSELAQPFATQNSPVIGFLVRELGSLRIGWVTLWVLLVAGVCWIAATRWLLVAAILLPSTWTAVTVDLLRWQGDFSDRLSTQGTYATGLFEQVGAQEVALFFAGSSGDELWNIQWWTPSAQFHIYGTQDIEAPRIALHIGSRKFGEREGWRLVEPLAYTGDRALWVSPGPLAESPEERGMLLPSGFPAPLPTFARRVDVNAADISCEISDEATVISGSLSITHLGDRSPLPHPSRAFGRNGAVRLRIRGGGSATAPFLSAGLFPGESGLVPFSLRVNSAGPLPTQLQVTPEQEGFGAFAQSTYLDVQCPAR